MDLFASCNRGEMEVTTAHEGVLGKLELDPRRDQLAAIIESPTLSQAVNIQFMASLSDAIYAYVFGDKMGHLTLRGVAFAGRCAQSVSGLKEVWDYYGKYRASQRQQTVAVTIGPMTVSGFLTQLDINARDTKYMMLDFVMRIDTLPRKGR